MPQLLLARVETCYQQAEVFFKRSFARPQISLALHGQKAGCAHLQENRLRFNAQLYRENQDDFLRQTVAHEVAHLLAYQLFGEKIRPHGKQWQTIMQSVYALTPTRCHQYKILQKPRKRFIYRCGCSVDVFFSGKRHALVQKGYCYRCLHCRERLRFFAAQN